MGLPLFDAAADPGPSFLHFGDRVGLFANTMPENDLSAHATTVVALKYIDGVVLCADRQATSYYVANRDVRKVEAADRFTAIAISGSAARGLEFIRRIQLSFEHYEKMTDSALSLEGKANYLSPLVQYNNLSSRLVVMPLLAGYDTSYNVGRVFEYDGAGGCYERSDFTVIGSGTPFAESLLRLGFVPNMSEEAAIELAALAIYEAADNDPSTGGPDFVRQIYPMMVTVNAQGFSELPMDRVASLFHEINARRTASGGVPGGSLR